MRPVLRSEMLAPTTREDAGDGEDVGIEGVTDDR